MLNWKAQGPAYATDLSLKDGRAAKLVLVADRTNPNGAAVLLPQADGTMQTLPMGSISDQLTASDLIEATLLQARAFGDADLPDPEVTT